MRDEAAPAARRLNWVLGAAFLALVLNAALIVAMTP
jgi:hypothetical protein